MKRFLILTALAALVFAAPATVGAKSGSGEKGSDRTVGTITAYDTATGELTITTNSDRKVTALVTDDTEVQCGESSRTDAKPSQREPGNKGSGRKRLRCADELVEGAKVRKARLELGAADAEWARIKLAG